MVDSLFVLKIAVVNNISVDGGVIVFLCVLLIERSADVVGMLVLVVKNKLRCGNVIVIGSEPC